MSKPLLSATNISKQYVDGSQSLTILDNVDIQINKSETLAIVGASGSGKSTLLHILGTLEQADSGTIKCLGQDLQNLSKSQQAEFRNKSLGFVYQFHHLLPEFSALENIAMPLLIGGSGKSEAFDKAALLLERVGLAQRAKHKPSQMSGGERQRIAIARALVNQPDIVLADEPTGNLDTKSSALIYELIEQINTEMQTSFILVTHDNQLAAKMHQAYQLSEGKLKPMER